MSQEYDEETPALAGFQKVDELVSAGFNATDIKKLREGGYFTVEMVAQASKRQLTQVRGISEAKAEKLLEITRGMVPNLGFTDAHEILVRREKLVTITTGSRNLDGILRGGIETGSLTELFGEYRTGKSQLCHTLAVTCQLPLDMGGGEGKCLFIDTENTFRPERIAEIAKYHHLDVEDTLRNIAVAKAANSEHQFQLLDKAAEYMSQARFSILIVDSIMHLFRSDYAGRGELSARQMALNQFLRRLQVLADTYGVAVVYTNQVTAQVDGMSMFNPDPKKPVGGNIIAHASTTRIGLKKGKKEQRIATIHDSPLVANLDCRIAIYGHGIADPVEEDENE